MTRPRPSAPRHAAKPTAVTRRRELLAMTVDYDPTPSRRRLAAAVVVPAPKPPAVIS